MAQEFHIRKESILPVLQMQLIDNGESNYHKSVIFNSALQSNTSVKFSMRNIETGILKVSNQPAEIKLAESDSCEDVYVLQYTWKIRDTKENGVYEAWFDINFDTSSLSSEDGLQYPNGLLKMPIEEKLYIYID